VNFGTAEFFLPPLNLFDYLRVMRGVIQRVLSASLVVDGSVVASIGKGIVCLIGLCVDDLDADSGMSCMCMLCAVHESNRLRLPLLCLLSHTHALSIQRAVLLLPSLMLCFRMACLKDHGHAIVG
jgi:hypothetical protein